MRVNQFHSGTAVGDAITNQMLMIQKILIDNGYDSNIYAEYISEGLEGKIIPINKYKGDKDSILFVHHSMGMNCFDKIISLPDKKALIYHNITPEKYFPDEWSKSYVRLGLKQAKEYKNHIVYCIADSNYNRKELISMGHTDIDILPVQISLERFDKISDDEVFLKKLAGKTNFIFVGRVVKNKRQDDVIKAFAVYNKFYNSDSHLYIIGDDGNKEYIAELNHIINGYSLNDNVTITGKVSESELKAYYSSASMFLCMSEHEGFGVPLLEGMKMGVPVVAYHSSAIPETMGKAGIIFTEKNYAFVGALMNEILSDQDLKERIINSQLKRIDKLMHTDTEKLLLRAINNILQGTRKKSIQLQGPFETSYSLAIVNRKLMEAMDDIGAGDISIYCTEGPGDYQPKEKDLHNVPHARKLWEKSSSVIYPDVTIRNMYPPRVYDVNGGLNFQAFGWEESVIPKEYIDNFNKYLNGIGTMSKYVEEKLIECGIKIPVKTMGVGVELPSNFESIRPYRTKTKKKFKFLHISSAFPRKGVDILLEAYFEAFTKDDDVCLILKTFPNPHNNVAELLELLSSKYEKAPEVEWINKDLSQDELYSLYKIADCYVQVARGEGFGLPVAEAMLAKVPVIVSNNSGMADFCNANNAFIVGYDLQPAATHLTSNSESSISMWAEPRKGELVQILRQFIEVQDSAEVKEKVVAAYNLISTEYTWKKVAERWYDFIDEVENNQVVPKVAMVTTWNNKCGIAEFSRMQVENSTKYVDYEIYPNYGVPLLRKDEEYVKPRLWGSVFEGDMNSLVAELEKSAADIIHFQFNFGFFKLKELGDSIKRLIEHKKVIIEFHKTDDVLVSKKKVSLRSIVDELNLCDALIVHQTDDEDRLVSFGVKRELIKLIRLGQIQYADIPAIIQQQKMNITSSHVIGSYGFLLPHKGIKEVIEAVSIVKNTYPDVLYLAVCSLHDSPESKAYYEECLETIEKLELKDNVKMITAYLDNSKSMQYLQACNCLAMIYKPTGESASGAIRFCIAARRPIITSNQPIFDEFRYCVERLNDNDPESVADAIIRNFERVNTEKMESIDQYIRDNTWYVKGKEFRNMYLDLDK